MPLLPIPVDPDNRESACGYVLRSLEKNGIRPAQLRSHLRLRGTTEWHLLSAPVLSAITGAPAGWYQWRLRDARKVRADTEFMLFGCCWRGLSCLSSSLQVCQPCIREHGICRLEWELRPYCACPEHRLPLLDHCPHCSRELTWNRPSLDVCSCGRYLTATPTTSSPVPEIVLSWCKWISSRLNHNPAAAVPGNLPHILHWLSIDTAFRLVLAFGTSRKKHVTTTRARQRFPRSRHELMALIARGLSRLRNLDDGGGDEVRRFVDFDALAWAAMDATTSADRDTIGRLLARLQGRHTVSSIPMVSGRQLDFFEDEP